MLTESIQRFKEECKLEGKLESIKTLVNIKFGISRDDGLFKRNSYT